MKGYLIEKYDNMANAYTCYRLTEEAAAQGIDLEIIGIHDTMVTSEGLMHHGELLGAADFVINRYKWGRLKDEINRLAERSYNPLEAYNRYVSKYHQLTDLRSEGFLLPDYVLGTALLPYDEIAQRLGEPFVAKGLESSMGEQIVLVESGRDLQALVRQYPAEKEWLFEEYIASSYGRDMRFYSIRGEVHACMLRRSQGDFRANVALGASVEACEITEDMRLIAKDIYRQTGLDFLGIDLLFGPEKPYFCEINVMPGIQGIEEATGVNVARAIIGTIREDFR